MESTVIEAPDTTQESNVGAETTQVVPEQVTAKETATEQPAKEAVSQEPVYELDGEKVPLSQLKKWKEDYANDSRWRDKNRRESEELNRKKSELAQLELIKPMIEQHPEVLQQLFAPQRSRDYDSELREHYQKRPDPSDYNAYTAWEMSRDRLIGEQAEARSMNRALKEMQEVAAKQHNYTVEQSGREKYLNTNKVSPDEFVQMTQWIVQNMGIKDGKVNEKSFDVAYKTLFEDKWIADMKLQTTQKVVQQFEKATRGGAETGVNKQPVTKTPEDEADDELVSVIKTRAKSNWTPLK